MLVMTAAASLSMAIAMAAVRPQGREGIGLWALALLLHANCYVLYLMRGAVPDWASVVLANTLLAGAFAATLGAVEQFQGRPAPLWRMLLPVLATAGLFTWQIDSYPMRLAIAGTVMPLQLLLVLAALWRPRMPDQWRGALLLSLCLAVEMVLMAGRAWQALTGDLDNAGLMQVSFMQAMVFIMAFVTTILASVGFILMTKDRADAINRRLAAHDELTGLANRRTLLQALAHDVAQAARSQRGYALILLDIDHFKAVNDQRGHLTGDVVLRHIAGLLRSQLRRQDLAGRYGGEEFLLLLPGTDLAGALQLAEKLRQVVEQEPCPHPQGPIAVTISLGVCAARPRAPDCSEALIQAADQALYAAKAGGRNRVCHVPAPDCGAGPGLS